MVSRRGVLAPEYFLTTVGACALVFLAAFESMAVTTIMPLVSQDLDGAALYALAFAGPLASGVIGMVLAGMWTDRSGPKGPLFASVAVFAAGLVLAGLATNMPVFLAGRLVQGLGAGAINVVLYVLIARLFPPILHPRIFAAFAAAWVVPSMVGPFCAGLVAQALSWHWVFLGVVVLVIPALVMLLPAVRKLDAGQPGGDLQGAEEEQAGTSTQPPTTPPKTPVSAPLRLGLAAVVALAVLGLNLSVELGAWAWPAAGLAIAVAVLAVRPLLPAGTLRARRGLPTAVLLRGLMSAAFFGAEVYVPYLLIDHYGFSPSIAGLALTFSALAWALGSNLQGRFTVRLTSAVALRIGTAALTACVSGIFLAALAGWPPVVIMVIWILGGGAMGLAYPRLTVSILSLSTPDNQGFNSSAGSVSDAVGGALSMAMTGLLFHAVAGLSFPAVFALTVLIAVLALIVAPRLAVRG
ncbi:MFS transporter [Psychromicrobium xiongbiense]|uniref:MFS transporter n=1 Tax=Psychromicrobium xiongbiense TaxID=3051184 RepID=UPI002554E33F|nr:MFS transporter [Psychromicrobium sp. YIM S02556]